MSLFSKSSLSQLSKQPYFIASNPRNVILLRQHLFPSPVLQAWHEEMSQLHDELAVSGLRSALTFQHTCCVLCGLVVYDILSRSFWSLVCQTKRMNLSTSKYFPALELYSFSFSCETSVFVPRVSADTK